MAAASDPELSLRPKRVERGRYAPGSSGNPSGKPEFNPILARQRMADRAEHFEEHVDALATGPKRRWSQSKCRICSSQYRLDVERLAAQGMSQQRISDWLSDRGISISRESIRRHLRHHISVAEIVRDAYVAREAEAIQPVDENTTDLERLAGYIERATRLERALAQHIGDCLAAGRSPAMAVVHAHETCVNGLRQAIKLRDDLAGGSPADDADAILAGLWDAEPQTQT